MAELRHGEHHYIIYSGGDWVGGASMSMANFDGSTPYGAIFTGSGDSGGMLIAPAAGPLELRAGTFLRLGNPGGGPTHVATAQFTAPALTSCGTSPSISGTDVAGTVTMGTGLPTGCTIAFNTAYNAVPYCTVTWMATPLATQSYTVSTSQIVLTQTATNSNAVVYHCTARSGG